MPLQRRLPKRGFRSALKPLVAGVRLHELNRVEAAVVDLAALKRAGVVPAQAERAKVFLSGKLEKAVVLKGIAVTKGAAGAIAQAGGRVEA
jgi:large subunit ribosomal protein L15